MPDATIRSARDGDPAVHALVIGVSRYDHLAGGPKELSQLPMASRIGQLTAAATSAIRVAKWFSTTLSVPGAGRGSVRLLASLSEEEDRTMVGGNHCPATYRNVREAVIGWRRAARAHPDNVAVLYVAGHGCKRSSDGGIALLQDFGSPELLTPLEAALDLENVRRSLIADCHDPKSFTPQRQYYFYDACRGELDFARYYYGLKAGIALDEPEGNAPGASPIFYGSASGDLAFGNVKERSTLFSQALLECLDSLAVTAEDGRTVHLGHLQDALARRLSELAESHGVEQGCQVGGMTVAAAAVHFRAKAGPRQIGFDDWQRTARSVLVSVTPSLPVTVQREANGRMVQVADGYDGDLLSLPRGALTFTVPLPWGGDYAIPLVPSVGDDPAAASVVVPDGLQESAAERRLAGRVLGRTGSVGGDYLGGIEARTVEWADGIGAAASGGDFVPLAAFPGAERLSEHTMALSPGGTSGPTAIELRTVAGSILSTRLPPTSNPSGLRFYVSAGERRTVTEVRFSDHVVDAMAGYLNQGRPDRALRMATTGDQPEADGEFDEIRSVLLGFASLRVGRGSDVQHWTGAAARALGTSADAAILAGATAHAVGRRDEAIEWLNVAAERGVPVFTEALSQFATLVRSLPDGAVAHRAVMDAMALADFDALTVTLTVDP